MKNRPTQCRKTLGIAAGLCLAAATPAQAADSLYTPSSTGFAASAEGWTGSDAGCSSGGAGALCTAATEHSRVAGNPPGSIAVRTNVTVNAAGLFTSGGNWTSPTFGVRTGSTPRAAAFTYDRRLDSGDLVNLGPRSRQRIQLVDVSAGPTTQILEEELEPAPSFGRRTVSVPADKLVPGRSYRLRIETQSRTTQVSLAGTGSSSTRFDNVGLSVAAVPAGGAEISPGVTIVRGPITSRVVTATLRGINWSADFGSGAGGTLVPISRCTIIGTPRNDVIKGTRGNDVICGLGGNDRLEGRGGRDIIDGGDGNDRLAGGASRDTLIGVRGRDRADGGSGNDRVGGGAGNDRVSGGSGNDRVRGGSGNDSLEGQRGKDRIDGGPGRDRLFGQTGNDRFSAKDRRRDKVDGGSGFDRARVDRRGSRRGRDIIRAVDRVR